MESDGLGVFKELARLKKHLTVLLYFLVQQC